jgi:hypothetical protein
VKDPRTYHILISVTVMPEENDFPIELSHVKSQVTMSASDHTTQRSDVIAQEAKRMAISLDRAIEARRPDRLEKEEP